MGGENRGGGGRIKEKQRRNRENTKIEHSKEKE